METLQAIPGTHDLFPDEAARWDLLRGHVETAMSRYAYGRIETPHFEVAQLFARSVGTDSDIVQKEMYVFEDRGGRKLALRPEGTAGVVRAFIEASLDKQKASHKLWYWGPMFRAERPQKGRYRQFWQFGVETFGIANASMDAEQMALAMNIAVAAGVGDLRLRVNSIGDPNCRPAYQKLLNGFLASVRTQLCEACQKRIDTNPLRVLDCKERSCQALVSDAPMMADHLCDACQNHFEQVTDHLGRLNVDFVLDGRIVRGLDYYVRTAFELESASLGAQSSILGGGRYDGLVQSLGGPDVPGVGWAAGIERFLLATSQKVDQGSRIDVFVASFAETMPAALDLTERLRRDGRRVETDHLGRSLKAQLKEASRMGARLVMVLGPDEFARGQVTLRDLEAGEQTEMAVETALKTAGGL
jgi:histidyl-tRNA synthetase